MKKQPKQSSPSESQKGSPPARVFDILSAAAQLPQGSGVAMHDIWGMLFKITRSSGGEHWSEDDVGQCLLDFRQEVIASADLFDASSYADMVGPHVKQVLNFAALSGLGQDVAHRRGLLTADLLVFWGMAARTTPEQEECLTDELVEVIDAVDALEEAIAGLPEDEPVRIFYERQLVRMRRAISRYRVVGARALIEAGRDMEWDERVAEAEGGIPVSAEVAAQAEETVSRSRRAWRAIAAAVAAAKLVKEGASMVKQVSDWAQREGPPLLEKVREAIEHAKDL